MSLINSEVRAAARARTLTVLSGLDARGKRSVLQFLYEAQLINTKNPIVSLKEADLRNVDLSPGLDPSGGWTFNLEGADLSGSDLSGANLELTRLNNANLNMTTLENANLEVTALNGASLQDTDLSDATVITSLLKSDLTNGVTLNGADLSHAEITQDQVNHSLGDGETKLPKGIVAPKWWR